MEPPDNIYDAAVRLTSALESAGIDYALGGAFAYAVWVRARATDDIDISINVPSKDVVALNYVFDVFESLGIVFNREEALVEASEFGMVTVWWGDVKIEAFLVYYAFQEEANRTKVLKKVDGDKFWVVSPESYVIFKLIFFRPKDIVDLEQLVAYMGDKLDLPYLDRWIVEVFGRGSKQGKAWQEIIS